MAYSLNSIPLSDYGFIPGHQPDSNLALSGHLDLPARIGKTSHSWAESKTVQPYVAPSEMRFGGRDLTLVGTIIGTDKNDCLDKSNALKNLVNGFTTIVPLSSKWGSFNVYVKSIEITFLADLALTVVIQMREPLVNINGTLPTPDGGEFGIDNYSFSQLGGFLTRFNGDRRNRPKTKDQFFTAWQYEGYQITKPNASELDLELFVSAANYSFFEAKIKTLYKILGGIGTRLINVARDEFREFFVTDGFKTSSIYVTDTEARGLVSFKATQVSADFYFLTDNAGNYITDNSNNKILIR